MNDNPATTDIPEDLVEQESPAKTLSENGPDRGRNAQAPWEIPLRGWRDVLIRTWHESSVDNISLVAAGMAFYAMLSVAPALAVIISVYGLVISPEDLRAQMEVVSSYLPGDASTLIRAQFEELISTRSTGLSWGIFASAGISLWSSSKAMKSMFGGLNQVYDERETRGWFLLALQSVVFTIAGIVLLTLTLGSMLVLPLLLEYLPLSSFQSLLVTVSKWLIFSTVVLGGLAVLYRYGPSRTRPEWRWVAIGSLIAWIVWCSASAGFSWYVTHFDSYQKTYGALGAVAILLMWFYVSAYAVLLGGELNAELEHQTSLDSTVGEDRPLGERGAVMADDVGDVPSWRKQKGSRPIHSLHEH